MTVVMDVGVWLVGSLVLGMAVGGLLGFANQRARSMSKRR